MALVSCFLAILAGLLGVLIAVFLLEVVAATTLSRREPSMIANAGSGWRIAVLVPAHNESTGLIPTVEDIKAQLRNDDRLLVVADNCSDDTAAVAAGAGAEVVARNDPAKIGKGYALEWGLRHLGADPPEIVIIIDADCRLGQRAIDRLAMVCAGTRRPVQALYLISAPEQSPINYQVAEFAWRVKNWVRPLGLSALRLPCQLMGTGMAFPWATIRSSELASSHLVEDLKLGLDLASAGHPPVFCPSARVTSHFPTSVKAIGSQRKRWEQGHIGMILNAAPRLLGRAIARRNWALLALTLDLTVPPLSLLAVLLIGMFAVAALAALSGFSSAALTISTGTLLGFVFAAFLSWLKCGRDVLPLGALLSIVPYVLRKLPLYYRILFRRMVTQWIRTERTKSG